MKNDRVSLAYASNIEALQQLITDSGLTFNDFQIHLRAYKVETLLEVWIKGRQDEKWSLLKTYQFCINSGKPGPKRKEGDRQIPEGFYHIDRFNPISKFHLSLGLNYPNSADLKLADPKRPGSDIFIHGGCNSVGCIAITDPLIEELYLLASEATAQGQKKIRVHLFPCRMEANTLEELEENFLQHKELWTVLKQEDSYFKAYRKLVAFEVNPQGSYVIKTAGY